MKRMYHNESPRASLVAPLIVLVIAAICVMVAFDLQTILVIP
jgi:hypothetical protein